MVTCTCTPTCSMCKVGEVVAIDRGTALCGACFGLLAVITYGINGTPETRKKERRYLVTQAQRVEQGEARG